MLPVLALMFGLAALFWAGLGLIDSFLFHEWDLLWGFFQSLAAIQFAHLILLWCLLVYMRKKIDANLQEARARRGMQQDGAHPTQDDDQTGAAG